MHHTYITKNEFNVKEFININSNDIIEIGTTSFRMSTRMILLLNLQEFKHCFQTM